jgi:hypothetical protein
MELTSTSRDRDPTIEQLEKANHQLQASLQACHELVEQYRSKLAANGNDPPRLNASEIDGNDARS